MKYHRVRRSQEMPLVGAAVHSFNTLSEVTGMVLNRFGLAAIVSFALCVETAFGAGGHSSYAYTGISVEVVDWFNVSNPQGGGEQAYTDSDDNGGDPVAANASRSDSWGRAFGEMNASATAEAGDLGVKFLGTAQVTSVFDPPGFSTHSTVRAYAVAEWRDVGTVESDFPVGPLILNGSLTLGDPLTENIDGGFFGTAPEPPLGGGAQGSFKIEALSTGIQFPAAPYPDGNWATLHVSPNDNVNIVNPAPTSITYRIIVDPDVSFTIGFRVSLRGEGYSGLATTVFGGDFSGSLHWGGIQSVTDLNGNPIPDGHWSIRSASGFDYTKPFQAPEPSSFVLLGMGGVAGLLASRGLKSVRRRAV